MVIEQRSRYLWTVLMRSKSASNTLDAFRTIIDDIKEKVPDIKRIRSDDGSEFKSDDLRQFFSDHGLEHKLINTSVHGKTSMALVERVNKTIIYNLIPALSENKKDTIVDILKRLTTDYNESKHSTTQCAPVDVISGECDPITMRESKYSGPHPVGTFVLRVLPKDGFTKRVMRYYPSPYLVDWVDDYSGKHHLVDLVTTDEYPILVPKYQLLKISSDDATFLMDNYDKHMKIYRTEQKDKSKSTMRRQQVQEFGITDEVQSIDDEGNVTYKPRLAPTMTKEERRNASRRQIAE